MSKSKAVLAWRAFLKTARPIGFKCVDVYAPGKPEMVKAILFAMTERDARNFWRSRAANPNRKETK